ncbi:MAG: hypothetical protein Fur0010_19070 [Bdellovibrio sp.]
MKRMIIFISILSFELNAVEDVTQVYRCEEIKTKKPPFYVSDEWRQGDKIWENFRDIKNSNKITHYIPRGSVVFSPPELYEGSNEPDHRVPVQVLSVPSIKWEENILAARNRDASSIRRMATGTKDLDRAKIGTVGWIDKRSLRSAGDYIFHLTDEAPIFKGPNSRQFNKKPFRLAVNAAGEFNVMRCCDQTQGSTEDRCFDQYKYQMLDNDLNLLDTTYMDLSRCNMANYLTPIGKDVARSLNSILKLLRQDHPDLTMNQLERLPAYQEWNGTNPRVIRDKMVKMKIDEETGQGPFGSYQYKPDDAVRSDAYLMTTSQCAFLQVLKKHQENCKEVGCQVQFGNMYHHEAWGIHQSHDTVHCIDIRPFRKSDDVDFGLEYKNTGRYDRSKTENFINLLKKAGATTIIFNDTKIKGVSRDSRGVHDDHIHVCFDEVEPQVQNACRDGI